MEKKNGKILLVEDDRHHAALLSRWLENDGNFEVSVVNDGILGSQFALNNSYDLIISDVNLPRASGFDIVKNCKAKNPEIPVLVISGQESLDNAMEAIRSKADDFLLKPFERNEIVEKSNFFIQNSRKNSRTILAIGAHPDDVEIGCGATLARHKRNSDRVNILTLSFGTVGGEQEIRRRESERVAEMLNANLFWGGLSDTKISDGQETICVIENVIREIQPDVIYTHTGKDNHQDHRNAHLATIVAARKVENVFCYQSPSTTIDFRPTTFTDVNDFMEEKLWLIAQYESQTSKCAYLAKDLIKSTARYWGRFAGNKNVEPFEVIRDSK